MKTGACNHLIQTHTGGISLLLATLTFAPYLVSISALSLSLSRNVILCVCVCGWERAFGAMRVCLVQRSDASVNSRSKCVCFSSRDIREMDGCCGNDPRSRRRTLKRNPIRVLESARCCFSSFPPLDFPVGQGKVSAAPRVNRLWNLRLKNAPR